MNWITPFRLPPGDRPHTRAVHMALVRDLYRRSHVPVVLHLASIGIFAVILRDQVRAGGWLWFLFPGLAAAGLVRAWLALRGERLEASMRRPNPRFALFTAAAGAFGLILGGVMLALLPRLSAGHFMLVTLCLAGLASLGCFTMAGSPVTYALTMLPGMASLALVGLLHPPFGMGHLFSLAILVYIGGLLFTSVQVHHALFGTVLLTLRLEDMALRDPLDRPAQPPLPPGVHAGGDAPGAAPLAAERRRDPEPAQHQPDPRGPGPVQAGQRRVRPRRGDAVLLQVARLLKDLVRKPDLVLRWGGEEFLILALDSDRVAPPSIAVRVHEQMARHSFILPGGQSLHQTCSVGYAIYPFHPERPEGLGWEQVFRLADQCLYEAKEQGRNRLQGSYRAPATPTRSSPPCGRPTRISARHWRRN